eukprot:TRINITY_DN13731_c0_g1_i2.p1 TRINITY_DN13731_c0_g1~~TRINITY_DN13731_c0_g1_i2.p1  ORF type:complete len:196 (+),score=79.07 TRINITY_DN13731_c0_g1_i2:166-753(+)
MKGELSQAQEEQAQLRARVESGDASSRDQLDQQRSYIKSLEEDLDNLKGEIQTVRDIDGRRAQELEKYEGLTRFKEKESGKLEEQNIRKASLLAETENENVDLRKKLTDMSNTNNTLLEQLAHYKTIYAKESFAKEEQVIQRHNERTKAKSRFTFGFGKKKAEASHPEHSADRSESVMGESTHTASTDTPRAADL